MDFGKFFVNNDKKENLSPTDALCTWREGCLKKSHVCIENFKLTFLDGETLSNHNQSRITDFGQILTKLNQPPEKLFRARFLNQKLYWVE